jgi:hypothetical protein
MNYPDFLALLWKKRSFVILLLVFHEPCLKLLKQSPWMVVVNNLCVLLETFPTQFGKGNRVNE